VEGVRATFSKRERLFSLRLIEMLFGQSASRSLAAFPLRVVYLLRERQDGEEPVQMLVSVPKKRFHHAVDRNRVKRQVREAYRLRKHALYEALPEDKSLLLAFVWLSDRHLPTADVAARVGKLLGKLETTLLASRKTV
jgi:ribonuclease P protein component